LGSMGQRNTLNSWSVCDAHIVWLSVTSSS
jgi:hypothetical protein